MEAAFHLFQFRALEFFEFREWCEVIGFGSDDSHRQFSFIPETTAERDEPVNGPCLVRSRGERMNHGSRLLNRWMAGGEQARSRDLLLWKAEPEQGAGDVLGGVDGAVFTQDFLCAGDLQVVGKLLAEVDKAGPVF